MKKILMGTTALVAAGAISGIAPAQAADPIQITISGGMEQWFGFADTEVTADSTTTNQTSDPQKVNVQSDSEIQFDGRTTLDNGITFGIKVELEANANAADQIDESVLFISGGFGRINIGSEDSAGYLMQTIPPDGGIGMNSGDTTAWIANPTGAAYGRSVFGSTSLEAGGASDAEKITYFTPRFAGLQFGVSYIPEGTQDGAGNQLTSVHDGVSTGLNYTQDFGGFNIAASGTFHFANNANNANTAAGTVAADARVDGSTMLYSVGANVGVGPISAGVSFAHNFKGQLATTNSGEGFGISGGVAYQNGPIGVSANTYYGQIEGLTAAGGDTQDEEDTQLAASLSGAYTLGPGIVLRSTVGWAQFDGELADKGTRGRTTSTNSGVFAVAGFDLSF